MNEKNILLVEDDLNLGFLLLDFLQDQGFRVKLCKDGQAAVVAAEKQNYDICLLDIMMPKMDGFFVAKTFKKKGIEIPIIFLTAKSLKEDVLTGYALGAEDYVTKPFDEEELLCKIKVILRRYKKDPFANAQPCHHIGQYSYNYDRQELTHEEKVHRLTEKENEVLRLLCHHKNRILKREDAIKHIYGRADYFLGRSFDVYISRLRKLLRHDKDIEIQNVFKVGFILNVKSELPNDKPDVLSQSTR